MAEVIRSSTRDPVRRIRGGIFRHKSTQEGNRATEPKRGTRCAPFFILVYERRPNPHLIYDRIPGAYAFDHRVDDEAGSWRIAWRDNCANV